MKNKMLIFLAVIVVLFVALYFVVDYKNNQAIDESDNPYGNTDLQHQSTIDQLDDPLYQNQILPDELEEKLDNEEDVVVYFFSPECIHCQNTTPYLVPIAEDLGVDMKQFNILEFEDGWQTYQIQSTPTLVYYEDGKEVDRIVGSQPEDMYKAFFNEYVVE